MHSTRSRFVRQLQTASVIRISEAPFASPQFPMNSKRLRRGVGDRTHDLRLVRTAGGFASSKRKRAKVEQRNTTSEGKSALAINCGLLTLFLWMNRWRVKS